MAQHSNNPFQTMTIISPSTQQADYNYYCQTGAGAKSDKPPFPRKVDLWFAGLSLAARQNLKPIDLKKLKKKDTVSIISGDIFDTDGWQAQAIMLIAIAVDGDLEVILKPRRMMDIANGLAAAGVPHIVKMLSEGSESPIWNLSNAFVELLHPPLFHRNNQIRNASPKPLRVYSLTEIIQL